MTESEWLGGTQPRAMLGYLLDRSAPARFSGRKFRLFACACLRQVWESLPDRRSKQAVEAAERYALGLTDRRRLEFAFRAAEDAALSQWRDWQAGIGSELQSRLAASARDAAEGQGSMSAAWSACQCLPAGLHSPAPMLLRDIFGNPFRTPVLPAHCRAWNGGTVLYLAKAIHEQQRYDDMAILGDALEESGCTDEGILTHCRAGAVHVPGCWVLDLLLGEE